MNRFITFLLLFFLFSTSTRINPSYASQSGPSNPPACNKVTNSGFESGVTGWTIESGQTVPPVISTAHFVSPTNSMQTGIPVGDTNHQSFSEFYQDISIPFSASSATLSFYVYTTSDDTSTSSFSSPPQVGDSWNNPSIPEVDTQYAYIMDTIGNVLERLLWWSASDTNSWTYLEFDLSDYRGETVRILFGSYNDGVGGNTAMWVDDVFLNACEE